MVSHSLLGLGKLVLLHRSVFCLFGLIVLLPDLVGCTDLLKQLGQLLGRFGGHTLYIALENKEVARLDEQVDFLQGEIVVLPAGSPTIEAVVAASLWRDPGSQGDGT